MREVEGELEGWLIDPDMTYDDLYGKLKGSMETRGLLEKDIPGRYALEKLTARVWRKGTALIHEVERRRQYEVEEKDKDIDAEKEKRKFVSKLVEDQKRALAEQQRKT